MIRDVFWHGLDRTSTAGSGLIGLYRLILKAFGCRPYYL
jgi:hypothetical protein